MVLISTSDILRLQEAAMGDPRSQEEFWGQTGFWEAGLGAGPLSSPPSHLPSPAFLGFEAPKILKKKCQNGFPEIVVCVKFLCLIS